MERDNLKRLVDVASTREKSEMLLKNVQVVNVFSHEIIRGNLAIDGGKFIGMGDHYEGIKEIDLDGKYIVPGLIDAHVHIESSSSSPLEFARAVLPHGVTTVVADPHEIANVLGLKGIQYMVEASKDLPLSCYYMLPSCVPATSFETAGANLTAKELETMIHSDRILGLGELMNYPGVINGDPGILDKVKMAHKAHKFIDGHGPVIKDEELNAYKIVGVRTDHECTTAEEMLNQIRVGMYIAMREGSACKDLLHLIGGVNVHNERRIMFCTDDRHPGDLVKKGSIDNNVRMAIATGVDPVTAIRMATLNTAECYQLDDRGAIAPGYKADFLVLNDLNTFDIEHTYVDGERIEEDWYKSITVAKEVRDLVTNSVNIKPMTEEDLQIKLTSNKVNVIRVLEGSIVTKHVKRAVDVKDGYFLYNRDLDIQPYYVIERHNGTGNIGKGFLENMSLHDGAIALTVSHDSHNLCVTADNTKDALIAINRVEQIGGGIVVVHKGEVVGEIALPIAGLMSEERIEHLSKQFDELYELTYTKLGINPDVKSIMTLSFMALPVIPELKLTDKGLFDVLKFKHIDINF